MARSQKPRWECHAVRLIAVPIEEREFQDHLATVARELYLWSHQLPQFQAEAFPRSSESPILSSVAQATGNGEIDENPELDRAA